MASINQKKVVKRQKLHDSKVLELEDILTQIGANLPLQQNIKTVEDLTELLSCLDYEVHMDAVYDSDIDDSTRECMSYIVLPKSPKMVLKLAYLRNQLIHFFCGMFDVFLFYISAL